MMSAPPAVAAPAAAAPRPASALSAADTDAVLGALQSTLALVRPLATAPLEAQQLAQAATAAGVLEAQLRDGGVDASLAAKLLALARALGGRDMRAAQRVVQEMAAADWKAAKAWHGGVRQLVTVALAKSG
jgi:hypothetical protein